MVVVVVVAVLGEAGGKGSVFSLRWWSRRRMAEQMESGGMFVWEVIKFKRGLAIWEMVRMMYRGYLVTRSKMKGLDIFRDGQS